MKAIVAIIFLLCVCHPSVAQVKLPALVRDSMVLQRDARINIWGWASPGEKVTIQFNKKKYKTTTAENGKWTVQLAATKAGGPHTMQISASNQITLKDILIGDVWFCSGQSNMVHQLSLHSERYAKDIAEANNPQIRHFWIPTTTSLAGPQEDLPAGAWKWANPTDVLQFSAVAYFFAKNIYEKYGVPIGLINASVGGTPIEAWTSEEGLQSFPSVTATVQKNKDTGYVNSINRKAAAANALRPPLQDKGLTEKVKWFEDSYVPTGWHKINIPGYWEDQGIRDLNGVVWYRKIIDVPVSMTNVPAKIAMGRIVDADVFYVNGKQVGNTTYQYPQRRYQVQPGVLKAGKNVLTVRVMNHSGKGGFVPDKPYYLTDGNDTIDLKGDWQYKVGEVYSPIVSLPSISLQNQPSALYNAMVAPLTNYSIKGVLWYQGESNIGNAQQYDQLLPALISDWRGKWKNENLPFLYVQLPNFQDVAYTPTESNLALLREAQRKTLSVPNTGMAVAIDLGEWNDIHPDNKKDVGIRLALAATRIAYDENALVYSGPLLQTVSSEGNKVNLFFSNTGTGLTTNNGEAPNWMAIAGADKKFLWAKTKLEGDRVVVWHDEIKEPRYVRYAWADNPLDCNLYNSESLPASPFEKEIKEPLAQETLDTSPWNKKKAAIVLTYDDALNVHLSNAIPALDSVGLKGTFYISDYFGGLQAQIPQWKAAAASGHELANHTAFHPCEGGRAGREFVKPEYDLNKYSVRRMTDEIKTMNALLKAIDGKSDRTFAFPCSDTKINDTAYIDYAKDEFVAARAVRSEMPSIETIDLYNLPSHMVNNETGAQLIELVKKAVADQKLLVFLFHGVGGEHSFNVSLEAHRQLLQFLKQNQNEIWVAPMIEVAKFIKDYQENKQRQK